MATIIPSLLVPDQATAIDQMLLAREVAPLQLDVVDEMFSQTPTWPVVEAATATPVVASLMSGHQLYVDLMVADPMQYIEGWDSLGRAEYIVHGVSLERYAAIRAAAAVPVWYTLLPDATREMVAAVAQVTNRVQVMGIATVGKQGQAFAPRSVEVIEMLCTLRSDITVMVDGSVNRETIPALVAAGATQLVVGSALSRAADWSTAYTELSRLATQT